jgi:seryl-tRNA synthetase
MLDVKKIIENPELIKARLAKKGCEVDFTELLALDAERKDIILSVEKMKA